MSSLMDPVALIWLATLCLGFLLLYRRRRGAGISLLVLALSANLLEVARVPALLLASLERPYLNSYQYALPLPPVDLIVVLGGSTEPSAHAFSGTQFSSAINRDLTGIDLARQGHAKAMALGGTAGPLPEDPPDGELIKRWIQRWQLTDAEVIPLPGSRNTHDEAVHCAKLAADRHWQKLILVTSGAHLPRAEATFRKLGLNVIPVGCDFVGTVSLEHRRRLIPQTGSLELLNLWLHEVAGVAYYQLRGWI